MTRPAARPLERLVCSWGWSVLRHQTYPQVNAYMQSEAGADVRSGFAGRLLTFF